MAHPYTIYKICSTDKLLSIFLHLLFRFSCLHPLLFLVFRHYSQNLLSKIYEQTRNVNLKLTVNYIEV